VAYCSHDCLIKDKRFHIDDCNRFILEHQVDIIKRAPSVNGFISAVTFVSDDSDEDESP
jgi:hypothetical protein